MDKRTKNIIFAASGVLVLALAIVLGRKYGCCGCGKGSKKKHDEDKQ